VNLWTLNVLFQYTVPAPLGEGSWLVQVDSYQGSAVCFSVCKTVLYYTLKCRLNFRVCGNETFHIDNEIICFI